MKGKVFSGLKFSVHIMFMAIFMLMFSLPGVYAAETEPITSQASVEFEGGVMELKSVPTIVFGKHPISAVDQTYAAETINSNIQISDLRGSQTGWTLKAALSSFKIKDKDNITLAGARLSISKQTLTSTGSSEEPAAAVVNLVSGGTSQDILTADGGNEGNGVWSSEWVSTDTVLTVLGGTAHSGTSIATITWTLHDVP